MNYWDKLRGVIRSRKGGWRFGSGVFSHGFNMMEDLVGKISYFQLIVLHATGRLPERRMADWIEAAFITLSWPDSRLWCNQIGALGGTARASVVAATMAGTLAADSKIYGQRTLVEGISFIQEALRKRKAGMSIKQIISGEIYHGGKPQIMGYARPIAKGDERVNAMERVTRDLGFPIGEHLRLAYDIEHFLIAEFDESMNITGYGSAFFADHGFSAQEVYQLCSFLVATGVMACYVDAFERPADSFYPLRCDDIEYEGPLHREVPED